ncbi:MAG: peptidoglycan-binding protein [Acidisphaera sp.]|nr:peptidoglycan-binding protein [Acidisphaera sp.]
MNSGPILRPGSTGNDVKRLQRIFVMMKQLGGADDIDGVFGPNTESAVKSFQQADGLTVDGVVGPQTWAALPADPDTPEIGPGATGAVVSALQNGLTRIFGQGTAEAPGPIDGDFGAKTEASVRAYQAQRGVAVDGVVGDQTWWAPAGAAGATLASLSGLTTV